MWLSWHWMHRRSYVKRIPFYYAYLSTFCHVAGTSAHAALFSTPRQTFATPILHSSLLFSRTKWRLENDEARAEGSRRKGREGTDFFGQSRLPSDSEQGRGRKESTIDEGEDGIDRKPGWQGLTVGASFPILNLLFTYIAWRRERGNVSCHEQFSTNLGAGIPIFPSFCLLSRVFGASVEWRNLSPFYRIRRERKKESFRIRFMLCRCTVAPCRTDSHSPLSSNEQETQLCAAG